MANISFHGILMDSKGRDGVSNTSLSTTRNVLMPNSQRISEKVILSLFEYLRMCSPVSSEAIHKQAKLYKKLRRVKVLASGIQNLSSYLISEETTNYIFRISEISNPLKVLGFYKKFKMSQNNCEIIEEIVWGMANILRYEDHFTPTVFMPLRTKDLFESDKEEIKHEAERPKSLKKEKFWNGNRKDIVEVKVSQQALRGTFQTAQEGVLLDEYQELMNNPDLRGDQKAISRQQLIKGSLIIIFLGMFDAHNHNIIVDKKGHIKFFDNTCCMPHSNGCVIWGDSVLKPSFRSGLLSLSGSYLPFTPEEQELISEEIETYYAKYKLIENFYAYPRTQVKIKQLPSYWLKPEESLLALKERIDNLKKAIQNPKVNNLCELSLSSQPNLRFIAAVTFLSKKGSKLPVYFEPEEDYLILEQRSTLSYVGAINLRDCIIVCCKYGFDLKIVKAWCDDSTLSFKDIIKLMVKFAERVEYKTAHSNATEIFNNLKLNAKSDYKDVDWVQ